MEIKVVDLQTLQGCSPVLDLLYFIVTGTDEKFREQYYEKLKDHYYSELEAAMTRLHLDPPKVYSRTDFEYELKEVLVKISVDRVIHPNIIYVLFIGQLLPFITFKYISHCLYFY